MSEDRSGPAFAEAYVNRCYENNEAVRWWAHDLILVGGSICDGADCDHLVRDFNVGAVLSVESEHDDVGKISPSTFASRFPFPDDGTPPSFDVWSSIATFARHLGGLLDFHTNKLYVHCQQGGSRSPAVAYFIMREQLGMGAEAALASIRRFKTDYGSHPYHVAYLRSAEEAIAKGFIR